MNSNLERLVSPDKLTRQAIVYVRQSSPHQVRSNTESTRLQTDLVARAVSLGWPSPVLIDEDLGLTASGFAERPGFQRMLTAVALRQVGLILCFDVSRLSRNDKDWAHLLEVCAVFDTLISDLDQIYNLANVNDRLLLGIKGSVAAMELSLIRSRLNSGRDAKAARGELKFNLPAGYCHDVDDSIVLDPDQRVQQAIRTLFEQFQRIGSLRQLLNWYLETKTQFPTRRRSSKLTTTVWERPNYGALRNHLSNPIFAGIYVWGRKRTRVEFESARLVKRIQKLPESEWQVRLPDHHPAYISVAQFHENQAQLAENSPRWVMKDNRGAVREGLALLSGLLRCHRCGSRMSVSYTAKAAMYLCKPIGPSGGQSCLRIGSKHLDDGVSNELLRLLSPLGLEAVAQAQKARLQEQQRLLETARLKLEAARYAAERAFQQYDSVDPRNRLIAGTLEQRWNERLAEQKQAELELEQWSTAHTSLSVEQKNALTQLAQDLPAVWNHPAAEPKVKKTLLRTAITEINVNVDSTESKVELMIHWAGGAHSSCSVTKRRIQPKCKTDPEILDKIRRLSSEVTDAEIARILSAQGLETAHGLRWTELRVRELKRVNKIHDRPQASQEETLTFNQVKKYLRVSGNTVVALVKRGAIETNQITEFAPWRVRRDQLDSCRVQDLVKHLERHGRLPKGGDPNGQESLFPEIPPS